MAGGEHASGVASGSQIELTIVVCVDLASLKWTITVLGSSTALAGEITNSLCSRCCGEQFWLSSWLSPCWYPSSELSKAKR